MPLCPFCEGEVSLSARKCKHCGEWVVGPPEQPDPSSPKRDASRRSLGARDLLETEDKDSLGHAANEWVRHHKMMSLIGLVVFVFFALFVFAPMACRAGSSFDRFDQQFRGAPTMNDFLDR